MSQPETETDKMYVNIHNIDDKAHGRAQQSTATTTIITINTIAK